MEYWVFQRSITPTLQHPDALFSAESGILRLRHVP
jgi:hypothetical protein